MRTLNNTIIVRNIFSDRDLRKHNARINRTRLFESTMSEDNKVDDLLDETDELEELSKLFDTDDDNELLEDSLFEDDEETTSTESVQVLDNMTDEELKDESLKIAINVAKLMTNVLANDIITIAGTIADFIRNHEIGEGDLENLEADEPADEPADENEDDMFNDLDISGSDAEDIDADEIPDNDSNEEFNLDNPFADL